MNRSQILAVTAAVAAAAPAGAVTIYANNFNNGTAGAAFSGDTAIATSPYQEKFLGQLTQGQAATLTLNTPGLTSVTLNFDLYAIQSLDGSDPNYGPDFFTINYGSGATGTPATPATLFNYTFSNVGDHAQSYPGPTGTFPYETGETGDHTLGYPYYADSYYSLSLTVPVTDNRTAIQFIGNTTQGPDDEGYGVDNITVSAAHAVPEPATWAMMVAGFGVVGVAMQRRRRTTVAA